MEKLLKYQRKKERKKKTQKTNNKERLQLCFSTHPNTTSKFDLENHFELSLYNFLFFTTYLEIFWWLKTKICGQVIVGSIQL